MTRKGFTRCISITLAMVLFASFAPSVTAIGGSRHTLSHITNVAEGKEAYANCYQDDDHIPSHANDGSTGTMWIANNGSAGNWWMIDLNEPVELLGGELVFEKEGDVWQYIVEGSVDGNEWEVLSDKTENTSGDVTQIETFSTTVRFVRVTVTGVPASRWTAICEVRLWGEAAFEVDSENIALGKATSAISEENAYRVAKNIVDGDEDDLWIASNGNEGNWVAVDLGSIYSMDAVRLVFEDDIRVWHYKILASSNGSDWITLVDKSSNNFGRKHQAYPVSQITARYVKVVFEKAPGTAWTALAELEVYGVEAVTRPPEKVLVIVPHEDDEALIAAGIIRDAILNGDTIKVAIVTNGDCNGYDKTLGINRLNESINAMAVLGLSLDNLTAFGYSDTGGFEPWTRYTDSFLYRLYHAQSENDTLSSNFGNTETYGVPGVLDDYHYKQTGEHADYTRKNFVDDLTSYITSYMPDRIYTTSAYDRHGDHAYLNVFVTDILRGIVEDFPNYAPVLYEMIVHSTDGDVLWPVLDTDPLPLQEYTPPANIDEIPLLWERRVSVQMPRDMQNIPRASNLKNVCLATYKSQYSNWIGSFTKSDEFFWAKDFSNLAYRAKVSTSSCSNNGPQTHATDGLIGGYLQLPCRSWIAEDGNDAWIQLDWEEGQNISEVVLHGIPNDGEVLSGTLLFSDGTVVPVGALPINGAEYTVKISLDNITWIRFTIEEFSGVAGIAEVEVF